MTITYEEYFEKYATDPEHIALFSSAFAEKGIDNYLFKEDEEDITLSVAHHFSRYGGSTNCLVIPTKDNPYHRTFAIFTKQYVPKYYSENITVESYERILSFSFNIDEINIENGLIRIDITIHQNGCYSKDRDFWLKYNSAESLLSMKTEFGNEGYLDRTEHFKFIECKGLSQLNNEGKPHCAKITNDSSGYCKWCHEVIIEELYDDYEPDYSELDQSAEDEAEYYMRLDNDIEIANGRMPQYNV